MSGRLFVLEDSDGRIAMQKATRGGNLIWIFKTKDDADAWIERKGKTGNWVAQELSDDNIVGWLSGAKHGGVRWVTSDTGPDADESNLRMTAIENLIFGYDMGQP